MHKNQLGFIPPLMIVLIVIILGAAVVIFKNGILVGPQPTPDKGFEGSVSAQIKPSTSSKSQLNQFFKKASPPASPFPSSSPNSSSSPSTSPGASSSSISVSGGDCASGYITNSRLEFKVVNTTAGSLWGSVTDNKTNNRIVFLATGQRYTGPGNAVFGSSIGSVRAEKAMELIGDGRVYSFRLFDAPDTSGLPQEGTTIATTNFSKTCLQETTPTTGTLNVTVVDANNQPIPNTNLELRCGIGTCDNPTLLGRTDSLGKFSFKGLPPYNFTLWGYYQSLSNALTTTIVVGQEQNKTLTINTVVSPTPTSPQITSLNPSTQYRGQNIDIIGSNFGTIRETVTFKQTVNGLIAGGTFTANVISWANDKITVQVPNGEYTTAKVYVDVLGSDGFVIHINSGDLIFIAK